MNNSRFATIKEIGDIGEKLVKTSLLKYHNEVFVSENKFDSVKDMVADGKTVEVKTLVKIKIYDAFCVGSSQIIKCTNVDYLFFVEIARGDVVNIYKSNKPRTPTKKWYNEDNCYFFKLTDLELYDTVQSETVSARLRELTPSKYL